MNLPNTGTKEAVTGVAVKVLSKNHYKAMIYGQNFLKTG